MFLCCRFFHQTTTKQHKINNSKSKRKNKTTLYRRRGDACICGRHPSLCTGTFALLLDSASTQQLENPSGTTSKTKTTEARTLYKKWVMPVFEGITPPFLQAFWLFCWILFSRNNCKNHQGQQQALKQQQQQHCTEGAVKPVFGGITRPFVQACFLC